MKTLKERLSALTPASIADEDSVMSYPHLHGLLTLLDREFPEVRMAVGKDALDAMAISRYVEAYQQYIADKAAGGLDDIVLDERFKSSLFGGLAVSYFSEVRDIVENDFPELSEEIEKKPESDKHAVYAALATEVYKGINGKDIQRHLYIPPYKDGYNDTERSRIRERLSQAISEMLPEEGMGIDNTN